MQTITQAKHRTLACMLILLLMLPGAALAGESEALTQKKQFVKLVRNFLEVIEVTHGIHSDPEKTTLFLFHRIQETYKQKGDPKKAAEVFRDVLTKSKNRTIRNSAYFMLADTLKQSGNPDQAIEVLKKGLDENLEAAE